MKISLKKLQKFATLGHDKKAPKKKPTLAVDELLQATQDLNDMRNCYESLHATGAELTNRVFELSESSKEMGDCLLEQTALNDDDDSGKVLLMLGKVEFEVQKLVDRYRSHIVQTITSPSENILRELRKVEEMKQQCDDKRLEYEEMMKKQKEIGRTKGKGFSLHHMQTVYEEYTEQANVFVSRMKSLKQATSHSLLTQATRHYFAQLSFAKKWVQSLEAIEPPVRLVTEQQHIDYQFNDDKSEIYEDDDESECESDSRRDYDSCEEGSELSFDYEKDGRVQEATKLSNPMELDDTCSTFAPAPKLEAPKETIRNSGRVSYSFQSDLRAISQSAPLFPERKVDTAEQQTQKRPWPSYKFTSYKLPTPDETVSFNSKPPNLWHSSPLDQRMSENFQAKQKLSSGPIILDAQSVLKESNKATPFDSNVTKKSKVYAFSGPLTGTVWPSSGPIEYSTPLSRPLPIPTRSPPSLSRFKPSPIVSSPEIIELHELPLPPSRPANLYTQSGPLVSRKNELSAMARVYPLQRPTKVIHRSFSIPTRGSGDLTLLDISFEGSENISSPYISPLSSVLNVKFETPPS